MIKRIAIYLGIGCGLLLTGYAFGRWRVPTVEKIVEKRVEVVKEVAAKQTETKSDERLQINRVTRWRTKVVHLPTGATVTETEASNDESSQSDSTRVEKVVEVRTVTVEKLVTKEVVRESSRPGWSIGAGVGGSLEGGGPQFLAEVHRRIVGPVWATVSVEPKAKAAFVGLRMEF